ncbi:MAG: hypothetical protein DRQ55_12620 [Planctomycetota bacterium]|nr:MAG: hypothetical protein DRQ55_12620 [Planctomycetota bacterium]
MNIPPEFELDFRPDSYRASDDPLIAILSGIKGTARRAMIRDYWEAGRFDELEPLLLDVTGDANQSLGRIHPFFMGGEFLPDVAPGEAVLVRIELQSTTHDVIELRARPLKHGGIRVRWVDEYEGEIKAPLDRIERPFSFGELTEFIEATATDYGQAFPLAYNDANFAGGDLLAEELRDFTSLHSDHYPQLSDWFLWKLELWLEANRPPSDEGGGE